MVGDAAYLSRHRDHRRSFLDRVLSDHWLLGTCGIHGDDACAADFAGPKRFLSLGVSPRRAYIAMATGEHYVLDLVAAVPLASMVHRLSRMPDAGPGPCLRANAFESRLNQGRYF